MAICLCISFNYFINNFKLPRNISHLVGLQNRNSKTASDGFAGKLVGKVLFKNL